MSRQKLFVEVHDVPAFRLSEMNEDEKRKASNDKYDR